MCGIAGFFDIGAKAPPDGRAILAAITDRLAHRGPDDRGGFADERGGLGFRRLSLVDVERGAQPVANEDGTIVTVCNGEFFDHLEIAAGLRRRGHVLQTACDAEILPHLYEDHGTDVVAELSGQFAFAVYDRRRARLFLARDHFGICPLYYTIASGIFLFASEVKALLAYAPVTRQVDLTGLDQVLSFPGTVSPRTMFKGINSLAPGHCLLVTRDRIDLREFWDLDYPRVEEAPPPETDDYYIEGVRAALLRSVDRRLRADVPVGIYLSGGLDSSAVAGMASALTPDTRHSFSVSFGGTEMCEQHYQMRMARRVRTIHHDVPLPFSDVLRRLPQAIYHAECPIKETHDTACLALSEAARGQGVPVALTGQGADELFAGYIGYRFDQFRHEGTGGPEALSAMEIRLREQLWGDSGIVYDGNYAQNRQLTRRLYSEALRDRFDEFDAFHSLSIRRDRLEGRDPVQQRSYLDFKLRLGDHLLTDHGDRMAMAHGVEVRHPFLDLDLVQFVRLMPSQLKIREFEEKYALKEAVRPYVDGQVLSREKFGWYTPGSPEVVRANDPYIRELLAPETIIKQGYFDPAAVERLTRQYLAEGFTLNQPYETDLLTIVLTFGMFVDIFDMPRLG